MSDLISRADFKNVLEQQLQFYDCDSSPFHVTILKLQREVLDSLSAVDAVPVVRCKDCKYADTFADMTSVEMPLKCLNIRYGGVYPDWYCEHGERRDDHAGRETHAD